MPFRKPVEHWESNFINPFFFFAKLINVVFQITDEFGHFTVYVCLFISHLCLIFAYSCPLHLCGCDCHTRVLYVFRLLAFCHIYCTYCLFICFCECKFNGEFLVFVSFISTWKYFVLPYLSDLHLIGSAFGVMLTETFYQSCKSIYDVFYSSTCIISLFYFTFESLIQLDCFEVGISPKISVSKFSVLKIKHDCQTCQVSSCGFITITVY